VGEKGKRVMKIKLVKFIYLLLMAVLMASCQKDPVVIDEVKTTKNLVAPAGFSFDMTQLITVSIRLPSTVNYGNTNRIIEFWSENADGRPGTLIKTGSADNKGQYQVTFNVPLNTVKIFTNCFAGWRTIRLQGGVTENSDGVFTVDYNTGYGTAPPKLRQGILPGNSDFVTGFATALKTGVQNMVKNGDFSSASLSSLETWSSPIEKTGIWYATNEAITYGSLINEGGNSIARINSPQYCIGGFTQLIDAQPGQVVSFSGDIRGFDSQQDAYLYLVPRNQAGEYIEVFSFNMVNPGISWINGTIVGSMPEGTVSCQILFYKGSTGIVDFDNAVVHVNDLDSDRDGDGVLDWEDNYPDNPELAFDDFYPAKDKSGTYAFEDLWPSQGDYDFNDLIVDYHINRISNAHNQVVEIDILTQVRAIGGSLRNGFGMQIDLPTDAILGIKNTYEFNDDAIRWNENGTESGQKKSTFILFSNAYNVLNHAGDGSPGINTTLGFHYVLPSEKILRIYLKEPVQQESVGIEKFNPFIFRTTDRSHEIHLSGFEPTDLADISLFGTGADVSDISNGIYYQTKNGLPWAINVPVPFDYTIEKTDVVKGYPAFAKWVSSGGNEYKDWYLDIQGYRNWEYIYRW
jgi:LruC domain-containing protein